MKKISKIYNWIKRFGKFVVSSIILLVALILSIITIDTTNIQNNIFIDNLLPISISFSIAISIVINLAINFNFITNNYNYYMKQNHPALIPEDQNILKEIKSSLEPITYFFIDRDLSLPWPMNIFDELFILENTLKIPSYNFANQQLQQIKENLHQAIVDFIGPIIQNEDLDNGMFCTRYYWFSKKNRADQSQLEIEKKLEDEQNFRLKKMIEEYNNLLTLERKILQDNISSTMM